MQKVSSEFSTSWCTDRVALYGSTTVSETLGDGTTEKVAIIRSGNSSLILEMSSVPIPAPAAFSFTSDNIEDLINKFSAFSIVTLCPVVACPKLILARYYLAALSLTGTTLTKDKVIWSEELTERTSANGIHGTRLEIDEDGSGNILVTATLLERKKYVSFMPS